MQKTTIQTIAKHELNFGTGYKSRLSRRSVSFFISSNDPTVLSTSDRQVKMLRTVIILTLVAAVAAMPQVSIFLNSTEALI